MKEDLLDIKRKLDRKKEIEEWIYEYDFEGSVGMNGVVYVENVPIAVRLCDVVEFFWDGYYTCYSLSGDCLGQYKEKYIPDDTYVLELSDKPILHTLKVKG